MLIESSLIYDLRYANKYFYKDGLDKKISYVRIQRNQKNV